MIQPIHIVGAGMAGSEAAWQAALAGVPVVLHEMRPQVGTFAHRASRGAGLRATVLQRCFRDIHSGTQHILLADQIVVLYQGKVVEEGSGDEVLGSPRAPYTQRLLASLPVPDPVEQAERRARWQELTTHSPTV